MPQTIHPLWKPSRIPKSRPKRPSQESDEKQSCASLKLRTFCNIIVVLKALLEGQNVE